MVEYASLWYERRVILFGRAPKQPRRVARSPRDPGVTARPNVTEYAERGIQPR